MATLQDIPESWHLLNACLLRSETVTNDNYAADLQRALENELADIDSARQFFQSTYPTDGLSGICRMIFNRLAHGDASGEPSIYRLDSGFGGGKTHTLIALAGAATHPTLIREGVVPVPPEYAPGPDVRIVPFTGENTDLVNGAIVSGHTIRPRSLMGHIALQVGGEYAYSRFRKHDESLSAPGSEEIAELLGESPCLILIDELMQMLRRYEDERFSGQIGQVTALCSAIAKAVEVTPKAVMVITTPDPAGDAYRNASQQVHDILAEMDSVLARTVHPVAPTSPDGRDQPHILRRRLFTSVNEEVRSGVSKAYADLCRRISAHITPPAQDVPVEQWFYDHYPFHPDTLEVINERLAANANFQKTRGTLRLLGRAIRYMRGSRDDERAMLLHLHHVTPDSDEINSELTSRINREDFQAAIKADILDADSTAERIDETRPTRPARRIARATLLSSLAPITSAQGLDSPQLVRTVITPYDSDPSVISNAITEFRNQALYVDDNPNSPRIRFTAVPNLNRILQERRNAVGPNDVNAQIREAITESFTMKNRRSADLMTASIYPSGAGIPDSPDTVHLGVINYEWLSQESDSLPAALTRFYRNSPLNNGESPRQYKNNMAILVADGNRGGDMELHARRHLAAKHVRANPPDALMDYQVKNLDAELSQSKKDLYTAIQRSYVNLYYPSTDQPISNDTLMTHVRISQEAAVEAPGDGQRAIIEELRNRRKLIVLENADLDAEMYWSRRQNLANGPVNLASLREEFAREPGNYMLMNSGVAVALFRNALDRDSIVIKTGVGQIITSGDSLIHLDDAEAVVYLASQACPDCHHHTSECQCSEPTPALCESCGRPQHPGACPQPGGGKGPSEVVQDFHSGLSPKPLNVLVNELRRYMEDNNFGVADIHSIGLLGANAEFINFSASLLGQNAEASVSYHITRGLEEFDLKVNGMEISEWSVHLNRIAPMLERMRDSEVLDASVTIRGGGDSPERLDRILDQMPAGREAVMIVVFSQKSSGGVST